MKILKNEYFIIYVILVLFLVYNFFNFYNSISVGVINHEGIPSKIISFINSDTLTLPALFKNLVFEGGKYSDCYLSAAPYFFPDILLFFILSCTVGHIIPRPHKQKQNPYLNCFLSAHNFSHIY